MHHNTPVLVPGAWACRKTLWPMLRGSGKTQEAFVLFTAFKRISEGTAHKQIQQTDYALVEEFCTTT